MQSVRRKYQPHWDAVCWFLRIHTLRRQLWWSLNVNRWRIAYGFFFSLGLSLACHVRCPGSSDIGRYITHTYKKVLTDHQCWFVMNGNIYHRLWYELCTDFRCTPNGIRSSAITFGNENPAGVTILSFCTGGNLFHSRYFFLIRQNEPRIYIGEKVVCDGLNRYSALVAGAVLYL